MGLFKKISRSTTKTRQPRKLRRGHHTVTVVTDREHLWPVMSAVEDPDSVTGQVGPGNNSIQRRHSIDVVGMQAEEGAATTDRVRRGFQQRKEDWWVQHALQLHEGQDHLTRHLPLLSTSRRRCTLASPFQSLTHTATPHGLAPRTTPTASDHPQLSRPPLLAPARRHRATQLTATTMPSCSVAASTRSISGRASSVVPMGMLLRWQIKKTVVVSS